MNVKRIDDLYSANGNGLETGVNITGVPVSSGTLTHTLGSTNDQHVRPYGVRLVTITKTS